jgi:ribonuclease J
MKIIIHRGADEIGGSCIELAHKAGSILLDLGAPLNDEAEAVIPPTVDMGGIRAVIVSHSHHDHVGLVDSLPESIPVYIGAGAERIMRAAALWISNSVKLSNAAVYLPYKPFQVAGFTVTPYPVDHSAFDSYALLIEAGGKKVFYTGDFRSSGYASYKTKSLLKNPPKDVDALLMEGTTVGSDTHGNAPEESLTDRICNAVRADTGLVFLAASSQNIDRLVTAIKAANKLKRTLVIDNYAYSVLKATEIKSITGALSRVKVFIHRRQKLKIIKDKLFDERPPSRQRVYEDDLIAGEKKYILLYRFAHTETFREAEFKNPLLIYSMWSGYFDRDEAIKKFISDKGFRYEHIHTSGHADVKTLQRLAKAVKPKMIIPVHTEKPEAYMGLFDNVKITKDIEL